MSLPESSTRRHDLSAFLCRTVSSIATLHQAPPADPLVHLVGRAR